MDVKLSGADVVAANIRKAAKAHAAAFDAAMFVVAGDILTALLPGVPIKKGALRASRWIPRTAPTAIEFSAPHAALAHELGRRKKFLQRPVSEAAASVPPRVAKLVEGFAKNGTTLQNAPTKHPTRPSSGGQTSGRRRPQAPARRR